MSRTLATGRTDAVGRTSAVGRAVHTGGRAASEPTVTNDVTYDTTTTGQPYKLNIYQPEILAPATIVHVHGGFGWSSDLSNAGATKDIPVEVKIDRYLAARGFLVLSINWRTLPSISGNTDTSYREDMISNVLNAVDWARSNAGTYNGPTDKIALIGESAGGQISLMATILAQAILGVFPSRANAVIGWSGLYRLDQYGDSAGIKNMLGISTDPSGAGAATAQAYSPYNQWPSGLTVPVRLCTFTTDIANSRIPTDQTDLATVITANGGDVTTATVSGSGHADFTGTAEIDDACAWIRTKLSV